MTQLDLLALKEMIRLLPVYSEKLDFDIVKVAYQNVIELEAKEARAEEKEKEFV